LILQAETFYSSVMMLLSVADETYYLGFHDAASATVPTAGGYFSVAPGGTVTPTLRSGGANSATGATFNIAINTWYRVDALVLSATQVWLSFVRQSDGVDLCGTGGLTLTGTTPTAPVGAQNLASTTVTTTRQLLVTDDIGVRV
jgi:hypothetical protein